MAHLTVAISSHYVAKLTVAIYPITCHTLQYQHIPLCGTPYSSNLFPLCGTTYISNLSYYMAYLQ